MLTICMTFFFLVFKYTTVCLNDLMFSNLLLELLVWLCINTRLMFPTNTKHAFTAVAAAVAAVAGSTESGKFIKI